MIRILAISMIFCIFTFVILVGTAVTLGHALPEASIIQQLHLRDCAPPCWMGLVPGQTRIEEAMRRFFAAYGVLNAVPVEFPADASATYVFDALVTESDTISIWLEFTQGRLDTITFQEARDGQSHALLTFGDLVGVLGMPTCVDILPAPMSSMTLYYLVSGGIVQVQLLRENPGWQRPIYFMDFIGRPLPLQCEITDAPRWEDFNPNRYGL